MKVRLKVSYVLEVNVPDYNKLSSEEFIERMKEVNENYDCYAKAIVGGEQDEWELKEKITKVSIVQPDSMIFIGKNINIKELTK